MPSLVFLFLACLRVVDATLGQIEESQFFRQGTTCNIEGMKGQGCAREFKGANSRFGCFWACSQDTMCIGVSLESTGRCHLFEQCMEPSTCFGGDVQVPYWSKYCKHGIWNSTSGTCKCTMGCMGTRCDIYRQSCDDLSNADLIEGEYRVILDPNGDSTVRVKVVCLIYPRHRTSKVVVLMNAGRIVANRTWSEYKNGFYVDRENHWIGLKALRIMISQGIDALSVFVAVETKSSNTITYEGVSVSDESTNYRLTYSHFGMSLPPAGSVMAGDCLNSLQNASFTTWDRDNDGVLGENCAVQAGYGWWFNGCDAQCRLLGWGLDDWLATPIQQRLSILDVGEADLLNVKYVRIRAQ